MEGKGRLLGWIAIGLGVVALLVALGGRAQVSRMSGYAWQAPVMPQPPANIAPNVQPGAPQMPGQQNPGQGFGQQGPGRQSPRQGFGPQIPGWQGPHQDFGGDRRGFPGLAGPQRMGPFNLFFWPFMLFRGVSRLLLFGLLIFLAVKFLKRRRDNGGSWRGPSGPTRPETPGPEQPPYTGETQNL